MPRINLIAEQQLRERRQAAVARLMLYSCGGSAALFFLVVIIMAVSVRNHESLIAKADQELAIRQSSLDQVERLQGRIKELEPRLELLKSARNSTRHWYLVFQQVGQGLPASSWLDKLDISHDEKTGQESLTLAGQSMSAGSVADTLRQLGGQPLFDSAELHFITQPSIAQAIAGQGGPGVNPSQAMMPVHFEVGVKLKAPPKKETSGDTKNGPQS